MAVGGTEVGKIKMKLVADGSGLAQSIESETGQAEAKASAKIGSFFTKMAVAGGAAVAAVAAKSLFDFTAFQRSMNEVFTLLPGISGKAMDEMTGQVKDFATEFGVLPDKVVPALYQALSAGVPKENVFAFLETAQKAAKGGVTDLTTAVDGLSSVVNAYGADVISATEASDLMFTAVRLGKTTFAELSANIFNVTPTAAALGVSFGQVTAALAAMTLQGVPTSVATTQLRQLFVELSKAGTDTSKVFEQITGKSFKEFIAGGGNVQEALQLLEKHAKDSGLGINDLFGSVEAGAAALALTGQGAEKFTESLEGMKESAGATQTAFEQMETGLGPIWDKLRARAAVAMLDLGEKVGGFISRMVAGFKEGDKGATDLAANLGIVVRNVVDLVVELEPVGRALALLVGAGVVVGLTALSELLAFTTGLLVDHKEIVLAVATVYAAHLVVSFVQAAIAYGRLTAHLVAAVWDSVVTGFISATASGDALTATLVRLGTAAATIAGVLGLAAFFAGLSKADEAAKKLAGTLTEGFDLTSLEGVKDAARNVGDEMDSLDEKFGDDSGWNKFRNTVKGSIEMLTPLKNTVVDNVKAYNELGDTAEELAAKQVHLGENINIVRNATGLSQAAVENLARVLKVDLTGGYHESEDARQKLVDHYHELVRSALGGGDAVKQAAEISTDAMEGMADAVEETAKATASAFSSASDIVSGFSAVAQDTSLEQFFADNLKAATEFASGIADAAARGLDPQIIQKLLEAGPQAAAPFLQSIAADHSGRLIEMANQTESALSEINQRVVAFARLTQQAMNDSTSDQKVRDLGIAMKITAETFSTEGAKTAEAIATKIGLPLEVVTRTMAEFGITVGETVEPQERSRQAAEAFDGKLKELSVSLVNGAGSLDSHSAAGEANRAKVGEVIQALHDHMSALDAEGATLEAKTAAFDTHIGDLRRTLEQTGMTTQQVDTYIASLNLIPPEVSTTVSVDISEVLAKVAAARAALASIPNNADARITGEGGAEGYVDGGIVHYFARGGWENHTAQIMPAGITRVWNEPEAGGEGYVPYALSKRNRSTAVLAQIAEDFGYDLVPHAPTQTPTYDVGSPTTVSTAGGPAPTHDDLVAAFVEAMDRKPPRAYVVDSDLSAGMLAVKRRKD